MSGKKIRLSRLTASRRRPTIIVPIDHGLTMGPMTGLDSTGEVARWIDSPVIDAVIAHKGIIGRLADRGCLGSTSVVLHVNGMSTLSSSPDTKERLVEIEAAVRLGADALSLQVNFDGSNDAHNLTLMGAVVDEAARFGLPVLAMVYDKVSSPDAKVEVARLRHLMRIAVELGIDALKIQPPREAAHVEEVMRGLADDVPVFFAGGAQSDPELLFALARSVVRAGGAGLCVGRNVFQHARPERLLEQLGAVMSNAARPESRPPTSLRGLDRTVGTDSGTRAAGGVQRSAPSLCFEESNRLFARAGTIDAHAFTTDRRLAANKLVEGAYPIYAARAEGPHVWDVDGNRFLDYMLAFGTVVLGHGDPDVLAAVRAEVDSGLSCSLQKANRLELIERLVKVVPGADAALLLKTGSDATTAAVRLARIFTGRNGVIRWGYHGWHDWCCPRDAGIPDSSRSGVTTFRYNDPESLERAFAARPGEVACLIMMPFELEEPTPSFLRQAKEIARKHGALFILDEVRTGFRLAVGGAQARYDVVADLAVFSKAIANGFEISAVTGRRDVLNELGQTHISSTFFNNSGAMAAAIATIRKLEETDVLSRIEKNGARLLSEMTALARRQGVPARGVGVPSMPFLQFESGDGERDENLRRAFYREVTSRGILLFPQHHWFITGAMTAADIGETLVAMDAGFAAAKRAETRAA